MPRMGLFNRLAPRLPRLWPGLPQLWRGEPWGLALAAGFAALLSAMLLSTWVWSELLPGGVGALGWCLLVVVWLTGVTIAARCDRPTASGGDDLFPVAISEYLQGNWVAAEQLLNRLLRLDAKDVDARLMLATLWRHTGRREDAKGALEQLQRIEGWGRWAHEIQRELLALAREAPPSDANQDGAAPKSNSPETVATLSPSTPSHAESRPEAHSAPPATTVAAPRDTPSSPALPASSSEEEPIEPASRRPRRAA